MLQLNGTEPLNFVGHFSQNWNFKLEQRERLNGRELTIDLLNHELFCEQFGPETYNAVRGYGLGVEWVDVLGIQTAKPAVSYDVASLQSELEASLVEITRLT